jgi:dienelactone hydrolase
MKIVSWVRNWVCRLLHALGPSETAWRGAALGVSLLGIVVIGGLFVTLFIRNFSWQKLPAFFVVIGATLLIGLLGLLIAALIMRIPRVYRLALALFAPILLMLVFPGGPVASSAAGLALIAVISLIGAALLVIRRDGFHPRQQKLTVVAAFLGLAGLLGGLYAIFGDKEAANPHLDGYVLESRTLDLPNPGLPGKYNVAMLTYGSGKDLRRAEYGEEVDIVARRVDGTKLIDNWDGPSGWLRTSYWGFDVSELPLQARVWMPDGDGPFPLVLVVHGNHEMEDFSDPGYDYLGELLASRGIILASVDQNFVNYTTSAMVEIFDDRPGLKEENDARGWLLLEHLAQWRDWNDEPGHRFNGKVDMDRVALIGHSRGGEAVGVAAAFNTLDRYPDDASLKFDFGFNLRGVIAIAPVYGQYEPRERPTPVRDVNYFTIHGDMDGDVQSFEGMAQYSRVTFPGDAYGFRAGLYVVGANHGQFNTTWQNIDTFLLQAWALDLGRIMDGEAQRDVARVYFSAFLEIVLHDRDEYLPIFKDVRYAADWLPQTFYINQFSDSADRVIVDFEEDIDPTTIRGGTIESANLSRWYETGNELKYDELATHSLVVAWDEEFSDDNAWVAFHLDEPVGAGTLSFSLSAANISTLPEEHDVETDTDVAAEKARSDDEDVAAPLDWTIELTDAGGHLASLPLSHDAVLYPLINAVPRRAGFLDSTDPAEVLFRRFEFALADFAAINPDFDRDTVQRVRFVFDLSRKGAIVIDDISVSP